MLSKGSLRIVPEKIVFSSATVGKTETTEVWVSNIGKKPLKIHFSTPEDSNFQILSQKNVLLVSGLEKKVILQYKCEKNEIVKENFSIISADSEVNVPIISYPPAAQVALDTHRIEMGDVQLGAEIKKKFSIANFGSKQGSFTATCNDINILLKNSSGILPIGESVDVGIRFTPKIAGHFKFKIEVQLKDSFDVIDPVIVSGNAISVVPTIEVDGKSTRDIDFGKIYFAQKKVLTISVVNNSNMKKYFSITQPVENKTNARFSTVRANVGIKYDSVFSISPCEGILNPKEKASVIIVFEPPHNTTDKEMMYNYISTIQLEGCPMKTNFFLTGSAVPLDVSMPVIDFNFEEQKVLTKTEKVLTITNNSQFLPINYSFKTPPSYKFSSESGTINPSKSKKITITFYPRNLGPCKSTVLISFVDGILKKKIHLYGVGVKSLTQSDKKRFRRVPVWEEDEEAAFNVKYPSKYGLSLEEIKKKEKQNADNRQIILDFAEKRHNALQKKQVKDRYTREGKEQGLTDEDLTAFVADRVKRAINNEIDQTSLGLEHAEGLEEPEPHIPISAPLPVDHPERYGLVSKNINKYSKKVAKTSDSLVAQKFKSKPTTPSEISECSRVLTPTQQISIVRTKGAIDFGRFSARSTMTKSFNVTNTLNQYIIVSLHINNEKLMNSTPRTQVIPPKQTAGFDIVFYSNEVGQFEETIAYTINGTHKFSFQVVADVAPIELELSRTDIDFTFPDNTVTPYIRENILITNKSNAVVEYRWTGFNTIFTIARSSGTLQPLETLEDTITFTPGPRNISETTAVISYTGGSTISLSLKGNCKEPMYKIEKKKLNLGVVAIGQEKEFSIAMSNIGTSNTIYEIISLSGDDICKCLTKNGSLHPGKTCDLQFSFKSPKAGNFSFAFTVEVAGAESTKINITAESLVPKLNIKSDQLNFGRIFVGSNESKRITITNVGCIPAVFVIDLTKHRMFHLEYTSELMVKGKNTNSIFCTQPETDACSIVSSQESCEYRVHIQPKTTIDIQLVFRPTSIGDFSFEMPFTLVGLNYSIVLLSPKIAAESMHTPLNISETYVDFGITTLRDTKNPNCRPSYRQITLQNENSSSIKYRFGEPICQDEGVFSVDEKEGDVAYSGRVERFVSFSPMRTGPFNCFLPVYAIIGQKEYKVASIQMTGVGTSRLFKTSLSSVVLPIVPLSVRSECTIDVINSAAIETNIDIKKAFNEKQFPLEITWPDGNQMKHSTVSLPLKISFCSSKPLAFTTKVALVGDNGSTYSFTIYAATDNSALTLYPFFSLNRYEISSGPSKPLICTPMMSKIRGDFISSFISTEDILSVVKTPKLLTDTLNDFLLYFLNTFVLSSQLTEFPGEISTGEGRIIQEMIENISSTKKISGISNMFKAKSSNPLHQKLERMKSMLTFLKANGAIIPTILPEFLLERSDFIAVMQRKITEWILGINYYGAPSLESFDKAMMSSFSSTSTFSEALFSRLKAADSYYQQLHEESWLIIVLQVLKVFLFSTVPAEGFNNTPGVNEAILSLKNILSDDVFLEINRGQREINSSNVFSPLESTLLKWATIHYDFMNPSRLAIITSFTHFTDARVLAALIKSHVPRSPIDLIADPETDEDFEHNLTMFIDSFNALRLKLQVNADLIRDGNIVGLLLFVFELYQILPHYVSSGQIEFNAQLSRSLIKSFEITNPSNQKLRYKGIITGSQNFKCVNNTITVPPHQTMSYMIEYFAMTHVSENATVTLTPYQVKSKQSTETLYSLPANGPTTATTIVLDLVSNVDPTVPISSVDVSGPTYGVTKFSIPVKNVTKTPGEFKIYTRFFQETNYEGKVLNSESTISFQLMEFITDPETPVPSKLTKTPFDTFIYEHQTFIFESNEVVFTEDHDSFNLNGEFLPISIGTFRCFILIKSDKGNEFVYEIKADSTLPIQENAKLHFKTEILHPEISNLYIGLANQNLCRALAYSIVRIASFQSFISETRLDEFIVFKSREIENIYNHCISEEHFKVECSSPQYFQVDDNYTITKENSKIPIEFKPTKPGNYSAKIFISSNSDFRIFNVVGIGLGETKNIEVNIKTYIGKEVVQRIPINNPSKETWHYILSLSNKGESIFTVQKGLSVLGETTEQLPIKAYTTVTGKYTDVLTVFNTSKEIKTIYTINAIVDDPPALDKIVINCKAREKHKEELILPDFIQNGEAEVESTLPFITTKDKIMFKNGKPVGTLPIEVMVPISGRTVGKLFIKDPNSNLYMWYVIEINVDVPNPEEIIHVTAQSRESVTINIPLNNDNNHPLKFQVILSNDDLFGDKIFIAKPLATSIYRIVFSPVKSFKRKSLVQFISDEAGEFSYVLDINATSPETRVLAQLSAPVGCTDSAFVPLNNMLDKTVNFTVENSYPTCFTVMEKSHFLLKPKEKKNIEVRFIASSVGIKETTLLTFSSKDLGEFYFQITGVGKPPLPLSPVCIDAPVLQANSGFFVFSNPFQFPARFHVSLNNENGEVFEFLMKKRTFVLEKYGDKETVSLTFTPPKEGKYSGAAIVKTVDMEPPISWTYPLVGTVFDSTITSHFTISGKANEKISKVLELRMHGESEMSSLNKYSADLRFDKDDEWIIPFIDAKVTDVYEKSLQHYISVALTLQPKRPIIANARIIVKNHLNQAWNYNLSIKIETGEPCAQLTFQSPLNKTETKRLVINDNFKTATQFHAYLLQGSSSEYTIVPSDGFIAPSQTAKTELPITVYFRPKIYGKKMHGVAVVDTIDRQYIFDLNGKIPSYVPPVFVTTARSEYSQTSSRTPQSARKRDYIRENIESARTPRHKEDNLRRNSRITPNSSRSPKY